MEELNIPGRPAVMTVYLSPRCPELRTRMWLEVVGFPPHLWSEDAASKCLVQFGGVTHFDAAEFRRSGRMVTEARVSRVAAVPKWVVARESVGVLGAQGPTGFVRHNVRLVVLSAEPVCEDEDGEGKMKKKRSTATAPDEQHGTEERPESVNCYL